MPGKGSMSIKCTQAPAAVFALSQTWPYAQPQLLLSLYQTTTILPAHSTARRTQAARYANRASSRSRRRRTVAQPSAVAPIGVHPPAPSPLPAVATLTIHPHGSQRYAMINTSAARASA